MTHRLPTLAAVIALSALTACAPAADGELIAVSSTDTACDLSATTAPAGNVTFSVKNDGSSETELYVLNPDESIVAEVEHIGPGLTRDLTVTLAAGTYIVECEPEAAEHGFDVDFTVTG